MSSILRLTEKCPLILLLLFNKLYFRTKRGTFFFVNHLSTNPLNALSCSLVTPLRISIISASTPCGSCRCSFFRKMIFPSLTSICTSSPRAKPTCFNTLGGIVTRGRFLRFQTQKPSPDCIYKNIKLKGESS